MYSRSPNTLGIRNNNPFNIRYYSENHWLGLSGRNEGFCVFCDMEYGVRAGIVLLRNYIFYKNPIYGYCDTIAKIVNRFAPMVENDCEAYVRYLCSAVNIERNDIIKFPSDEFADLCVAIMFYESQYIVPRGHIYYIINKFKIY